MSRDIIIILNQVEEKFLFTSFFEKLSVRSAADLPPTNRSAYQLNFVTRKIFASEGGALRFASLKNGVLWVRVRKICCVFIHQTWYFQALPNKFHPTPNRRVFLNQVSQKTVRTAHFGRQLISKVTTMVQWIGDHRMVDQLSEKNIGRSVRFIIRKLSDRLVRLETLHSNLLCFVF